MSIRKTCDYMVVYRVRHVNMGMLGSLSISSFFFSYYPRWWNLNLYGWLDSFSIYAAWQQPPGNNNTSCGLDGVGLIHTTLQGLEPPLQDREPRQALFCIILSHSTRFYPLSLFVFVIFPFSPKQTSFSWIPVLFLSFDMTQDLIFIFKIILLYCLLNEVWLLLLTDFFFFGL